MNANNVSVTGTVQDVFAHRFTLRTAKGVVLADLTPHGRDEIALAVGDEVTIEGERKPSEIKVAHIRRGDVAVNIAPGKKPEPRGAPDPQIVAKAAVASARAAGFEIIGEPRRKPKHFEILGRKNGDLAELHIHLDGGVRHIKPVPSDDGKWRAEVAAHR